MEDKSEINNLNDLVGSIFTLNLSCFIKAKKTEQNLLKYHLCFIIRYYKYTALIVIYQV